jgi:hypothetical protein
VRTLVEAHLAWVLEHEAEEARFIYQALALELDGGHRTELCAVKARLKQELHAHLAELGLFAGVRSPELTLDVVLLGPTHQACRAYFAVQPFESARCLSPTTAPAAVGHRMDG